MKMSANQQELLFDRAVVLVSGGLDSSIVLHLAARECRELHTLAFRYGQMHTRELECASWQSESVSAASHRVIDLALGDWGGSSLTDRSIPIEAGDLTRVETPNTYVPARNMVFLSVAASFAEAIGAEAIYLGVSQADYSGYVDCRREFLVAMSRAINAGTERKTIDGRSIRLIAPFLEMRKADEIQIAQQLGVDLSHTWSCYAGGDTPCGACDSCLLRARAFAEAGVADPLLRHR